MTPPTSAVWVEWFLPAYLCLQGPGWKVYPSFLDIAHDFGYFYLSVRGVAFSSTAVGDRDLDAVLLLPVDALVVLA